MDPDNISLERLTEETSDPEGSSAAPKPPGAASLGAFLQLVIDSAPVLLFLKESGGRYLYVNSAYEEAVGISREQILGRTDFDLFPHEMATAYLKNDLLAMVRVTPVRTEEITLVDGEERTFAVVKFPILDDGKEPAGVCGVAVDLTHSLQTDATVQADKEGIVAGEFFGRLIDSLTVQEARVLDLVAEGLSDGVIAKTLSLTSGTVRHHVSHVLKKLRKSSRTQAAVQLLKHRSP
jgi:PAS domain S-box-containing protein